MSSAQRSTLSGSRAGVESSDAAVSMYNLIISETLLCALYYYTGRKKADGSAVYYYTNYYFSGAGGPPRGTDPGGREHSIFETQRSVSNSIWHL